MKMMTHLWTTIETFTATKAVLAEWKSALGAEFDKAKGFLRPTQQQTRTYPCTNKISCDCRHEVVEVGESNISLLAVCQCDHQNCPAIHIEPKDIVVHELDLRKIGEAIRIAFRFDASTFSTSTSSHRVYRIASYGSARIPVYFTIPIEESVFLKDLEEVLSSMPDPFILLTPTHMHHTPTIESILKRHQCAYIPLSMTLSLDDKGQLRSICSIDGILADFQRRLTEGSGLPQALQRIDKNIEAVAKGHYELNKQNEELRKLHAEGYLKFVSRFNSEDFRALAAIMLFGNRKAAAESLNIPSRTFYDRVSNWKKKGPEYKRLFQMVEWRKKNGCKITVPLGNSLQSGEPSDEAENPETINAVIDRIRNDDLDQKSYPELLRDILIVLQKQNPENWKALNKGLIDLISEELPQ